MHSFSIEDMVDMMRIWLHTNGGLPDAPFGPLNPNAASGKLSNK